MDGYRLAVDSWVAPGGWVIVAPDRGPWPGAVLASVADVNLGAVLVAALNQLRGWIE